MTPSIDLLSKPFREFDQSVDKEASIWFDEDCAYFGVTYWEPDSRGRLPGHEHTVRLEDAATLAISFVNTQ